MSRAGLGDVVVVVANVAVVVAESHPGLAILHIIFYYDTKLRHSTKMGVIQCVCLTKMGIIRFKCINQ